MKKILCLILLLSACSRPSIDVLETKLADWLMQTQHIDTETALIKVCRMRVWIKMSGLDWREFIEKKMNGYDVSYTIIAFNKLDWSTQYNVQDMTRNCKDDKFYMYAARD